MNVARYLLPALALCALSPAAFADRFYFGTEDAAEKMVEGEPDYLEGVLLKEEDGFYVIRVQGGEVRVPKASVRKIEKDGLTADAIAEREKADAEYLAEANALRSQMIVAEASARRERIREARAAEASAVREPVLVEAAVPVATPVYDPVLGLIYPPNTSQYMVHKELGGIIRRKIQRQAQGRPYLP